LLGSALALDVGAQKYPDRPIRIIVGYVPGGGADVLARLVASKLSEQFGQPVIVENRPGGGTSIAIARVANASPDGYTLLIMNAAGTALPSLRHDLGYKLERDLAPISMMTTGPYLLVVNASSSFRNVGDVIAAARAKPGVLRYGTSGAGTSPHLMGELLSMMAKVKITHVPYKGGAQSAVAVASNEIDMSFPSIPVALPLMASNRVRPIGITTAKRASFLPNVPTISESGLTGYDLSVWYGMLTPAGLPKSIVARLNSEMVKTMNLPDIKETLAKLGMDATSSTPEQFAAFLREDLEKNAKLIKFAGIKAD
jgi:tripartite-type tricarboxylate transporter receptor subunit TctC